MTAYLILATVLACPLVYLVLRLTWGRRWQLPEGRGFEVWGDGSPGLGLDPVRLTLIADDATQERARLYLYAVIVTRKAWLSRGWELPHDRARYVVVWEPADYDAEVVAAAERKCSCEAGGNGILLSVGQRLAGGVAPMLAIRSTLSDGERLSLVVHELVHHLVGGDGDDKHSRADLWAEHEADPNVERDAFRVLGI